MRANRSFATPAGNPGEGDDALALVSNTGRLASFDTDYDVYSGIPRMSAIPVSIIRLPFR